MLATEWPDWLDAEFLRSASTAGVFVVCVLLLVVIFWVRSLATKLLLLVLLAAGAFGLFVYRDDLKQCASTCDCSFLGDHISSEGCGFVNPNDS